MIALKNVKISNSKVTILFTIIILLVNSVQLATPLDNRTQEDVVVVVGNPINVQDKQNFTSLFNEIKKLKLKKTPNEIKQITIVGLLSGALKVEKNMKANLKILVNDFNSKFNSSTHDENMDKIFSLEETMERDKRAIQILSNALDYAREVKSYEEYKDEMESIAKDSEISLLLMAKKKFSIKANQTSKNSLIAVAEKMQKFVQQSVDHHLMDMHSIIKLNAKQTIKHLHDFKDSINREYKVESTEIDKRLISTSKPRTTTTTKLNNKRRIWRLPISALRTRRQDNNDIELIGNEIDVSAPKPAKQDNDDGSAMATSGEGSNDESGSSSSSSEEMPGGLVGLIASLSGGDEGSDIGALIGALSGVITNIFGPGGFDVPSLLGTATGLIAGLLAGDENFGKVLGSYIGIAVDGFSGGGGAILNGQFFGQFLGTVFAELSANPEDDDLPPEPALFIRSAFEGSKAATSKAGNEESGEDGSKGGSTGSDSFGFITNIVTSLVGGLTNFMLNAFLGSSGGSSQGSAGLSGDLSGSSISGSSGSSLSGSSLPELSGSSLDSSS